MYSRGSILYVTLFTADVSMWGRFKQFKVKFNSRSNSASINSSKYSTTVRTMHYTGHMEK